MLLPYTADFFSFLISALGNMFVIFIDKFLSNGSFSLNLIYQRCALRIHCTLCT